MVPTQENLSEHGTLQSQQGGRRNVRIIRFSIIKFFSALCVLYNAQFRHNRFEIRDLSVKNIEKLSQRRVRRFIFPSALRHWSIPKPNAINSII